MKNNKPLVSVIMRCYNHAKYVGAAIESVLNQTYDNIEFIVADNGSTDNSYEVIKRYENRLSKIIHLEENDIIYCGECLRKEAHGEYLAIMTSDDYWEKEKLELQMQVLINNPQIEACTTWAIQTDENLGVLLNRQGKNIFQVENRTRQEWFRRFILRGNCLAWPTAVIKTKTYERIDKKTPAYLQLGDMYFWIQLVLEGELYVVQKELAKFRWHEKGDNRNVSAITQESSVRLLNESADIVDHILEIVDDIFFKEAFKNELIYPDATTHTEILCEKCFLLKRMAERNRIYQSAALRYMYKYFMECRGVFEEKYQFGWGELHKWSSKMGIAKIQQEFTEISKTANLELDDKKQIIKGLKKLYLNAMDNDVKDCMIKRSLFHLLSSEKKEFINQIKLVAEQAILKMNLAMETENIEIYKVMLTIVTNLIQAMDLVWEDLKFLEFKVDEDDWNVYKELINYASQEQIDLLEAILPFTQYIYEQLKEYFEEI